MKPFLIAAITLYALSVITVVIHHASGSEKARERVQMASSWASFRPFWA
ncbi:MAG: hypothetical protein HS130_08115 [Deltaproteobacteria bacterium]|nr:hypothetical protein [Deltaproteobacteria bacterium]